MLGISLDIDREAWETAIKKDTLSWDQVCDFTGLSSETAKQYAILTLPTNIPVSYTHLDVYKRQHIGNQRLKTFTTGVGCVHTNHIHPCIKQLFYKIYIATSV